MEIFVKEFKVGQQLAIGFSTTKPAATGSKYVFSLLSLMTKVDEFLKIGIINRPAQPHVYSAFLMQMSHSNSHSNEVKAMEKKVIELEPKIVSLKRENDAVIRFVNNLEGKNGHLQSLLDKLMSEGKKKGWF